MTADQLRELADRLTDKRLNLFQFHMDEAANYLRACADALEAGPVAWMYDFLDSKTMIEDWLTDDREEAYSEEALNIRPLYPLAMPALAIPQGWRLVPVEPTPEMCAGSAVASSSINRHIYKTMLAAAPTPPVAALRLPEPMTSSEIGDYARSMVKAGRSVDWLAMQIEAEVIRRVKECNE